MAIINNTFINAEQIFTAEIIEKDLHLTTQMGFTKIIPITNLNSYLELVSLNKFLRLPNLGGLFRRLTLKDVISVGYSDKSYELFHEWLSFEESENENLIVGESVKIDLLLKILKSSQVMLTNVEIQTIQRFCLGGNIDLSISELNKLLGKR